jgi:hypothetical protein
MNILKRFFTIPKLVVFTDKDVTDSLYTKYGYYHNTTEFCNDCNKLLYKGICLEPDADMCVCSCKSGTYFKKY